MLRSLYLTAILAPAQATPVGDSLQRAAELNGEPITFYGFDWDYGGNVATLDGKLASLGGCSVHMRLGIATGQ